MTPGGEGAIRILLADDHQLVRETMRRSMEDEGFEIVGEAVDGEEAVRFAQQLSPDIVLMDVSMPVLDGVEATRMLKQRTPATRIVMLTMHADADVIRRSVEAGAVGYLTKDCTVSDIVDAVRLAHAGETAISAGLASAMLAEATRTRSGEEPLISPREVEVLQLIAEGASPVEVGEKLYISVKTVKNHLSSIYAKLDARDRTQAVLKGLRMGIIRLD